MGSESGVDAVAQGGPTSDRKTSAVSTIPKLDGPISLSGFSQILREYRSGYGAMVS